MMLPDSPQNLVVIRAPSPSVHYLPGSMNSETSSALLVNATNHQPTTISTVQPSTSSVNQPVSESWCLTSVKVIKVSGEFGAERTMFVIFYDFSFPLTGRLIIFPFVEKKWVKH